MMNRKLLLNIRGGRAAVSFITIAPIMMAVAALTLAAPAFAQSTLDSSSAPDTGYALPPPDGGPLADPAMPNDAAPNDAMPNDGIEPIAAADGGSGGAAARSGWDRIGDVDTSTASEDPAGKVLELPQVVPPATAQPSDGADQTAQDGASSSPDQVGSVDDYQDAQDSTIIGVYVAPLPTGPWVVNPYGVGTFRSNQAPMNPRFLPGFVPMFPPGATAMRPLANGMNAAIVPASPMLPRSSAPIPGGWWNRAR